MEVNLYSDSDKKRWDRYVLNHTGSTHCHLAAWKNIIEETYGHKGYYLIAEDDSEIHGLLPLVHVKSFVFGNHLVSMPFLNYGGILADSSEIASMILNQAIKMCSDLKASSIELRCLDDGHALSSSSPANYRSFQKTSKVSMILSLPDSADKLFKSFKSKLRSQIARPQKEGMTFAIGGEEFLDDFYRVFTINMRDLGSPVHSKMLFHKLLHHLGDSCKVGVVRYGNSPVAAGLIIVFRDTVETPWASSLREYNRLSPNMFLYWSLLEYSCGRGLRYFDFGRSTPGGGTYRFKEQWGAQPQLLHWNVYGRSEDGGKAAGNSTLMTHATQIWQKLPVSVTNLIGPRIRASIPL